jgi:hypothetical protein
MEIKFPLKLKKDGDGHVVLKEDKPIYIDQEGQEVALDAPKLWGDLKAANNESAGRRVKLEEMEATAAEQAKRWEGIDPEEAKKAIETVKNFNEKQMVDAGEVDRIKQGVKDGYEEKLKQQKESFERALTEKDKMVVLKDNQIRNLLVRGAFEGSNYLREKTVLFPGAAFAYFGDYFDIEEINGELRAVGKIDKKPIISRSNPGEIASTEEAIEILIENNPQKERILKVQGTGGGGFSPDAGGSATERSLVDAMYPTMKKGKQ